MSKRQLSYFVVLCVGISFLGCVERVVDKKNAMRVGVYDSRAIAVAYAGSEFHEARIREWQQEKKEAESRGDSDRIAELGKEAETAQHEMHLQGFSVYPVDEYLEHVDLGAIMKEQNLGAVVSKWSQDQFDDLSPVIKVDVTDALIEAFDPNPVSRQHARNIQRHKPVPLDKIETQLAKHPH